MKYFVAKGEAVYHFRTCTNIYTYTHCIAQTATKSSVTELLSVEEKRWLLQTLMSSHLFLDFYIHTQKNMGYTYFEASCRCI